MLAKMPRAVLVLLIVASVPAAAGGPCGTAPDVLFEPSEQSVLGTAIRSTDDARTEACAGQEADAAADEAAQEVLAESHDAVLDLFDRAGPIARQAKTDASAWGTQQCSIVMHRFLGVPGAPC